MKMLTVFQCTLATCLLPLLALRAEEFRTFQNREGKSLKAALVAVNGSTVSLKLDSGRVVQGDASFFSPEDQEYIKKWTQLNQPASYKFRVKVTPFRKSRSAREEGAVKVTYEEWAYKVELENMGDTDLADLTAEYRIYKRLGNVDADNARDLNKQLTTVGELACKEGKLAIGQLARLADAQFETEPLPMTKSDLKGGWYYPSGRDEKGEDELKGIWLRVIHGSTTVFEHKTVKGKVAW